MSRRGMTVVELLVAATTFLVMLGFVSLAVVSYLRASRSLMPQDFSNLSLTSGLDSLTRQLRNSTRIYTPDAATLKAGFRPTAQAPLVLALRDSTVTGYFWEASLQRLVFEKASYEATQLPTVRQKVADASGCWLQLQGDPDHLELTLRLEAPAPMRAYQTALFIAGDLLP